MTDRDAGIDRDGITRNIARTINHVEILEGKSMPHDWSWVCKSLWKKGADDGCKLNILDSVLTNASQPQAWFFTNRDGMVSKKSAYTSLNAPYSVRLAMKTVHSMTCSNPKRGGVGEHGAEPIRDDLARRVEERDAHTHYADPAHLSKDVSA